MVPSSIDIQAIVFDMDGVLIDSEYTYLQAKTEILKEAGFPKDISYQYQFMGTTYDFMWSTMKEELGLPEPIEFYIQKQNEKRQKIMKQDGVKAINGVHEFIKQLSERNIKLAVASSSPKKEILNSLDALGIIQYFDVVVSGEEVAHSKPAPDVFLEAARQLKVPSQRCLAFEDTKNGALSASRAGMTVIGFQNPDYPPQDLSVTDKVITSFGDLSVKELISY